MVSTDDAYVRANNTTLGAKVSGYVVRARLRGQHARCTPARCVIARIDDGDYKPRGRLPRARRSPTQQATVERFDRQIDTRSEAAGRAGPARSSSPPRPTGQVRTAISKLRAPAGAERQ